MISREIPASGNALADAKDKGFSEVFCEFRNPNGKVKTVQAEAKTQIRGGTRR